jgi:hypothetical protein
MPFGAYILWPTTVRRSVAVWPGAWPADPVVALGIAAWSVWEGRQSWRGANCC